MSNPAIEELAKRVETMSSRITLREPFIGAIFPKLHRIYHEEPWITGYTDGRSVGFGVHFCSQLNNEQLMGLCLHEAMHVVLMHMWRWEGYDHRLFNIAADAIINLILKNMGYILPEGAIFIDWVTEEMSTEEVYTRLQKEQPPEGGSGGSGQGQSGGDKTPQQGYTGGGGFDGTGDLAPAIDPADAADMEATIMAAAKMAKACGHKGALLDRILGGGLAPTVNWLELLRHVVTEAARNDYSFRRGNKRFLPDLYLPTLRSLQMGPLVIGVDTSGSVGQAELNQMAGEIQGIIEDCKPRFIEVVYIDTDVKGVQRFEPEDTLELKAKGGGGTAFAPLFEYIEQELDEAPAAVLYLTDLCGDYKACRDPGVPVIWGCTYRSNDSADVPFGIVAPVII